MRVKEHLSLRLRRQIVREFKAGKSAPELAAHYWPTSIVSRTAWIEAVLRDFLHWRFTLEPKRKPSTVRMKNVFRSLDAITPKRGKAK